jgi:NADH-quinone oxidoreductase subunit G
VAGHRPGRGAVTYDDLSAAPAVLLAGFEPEEESPIVFLRLRRAVRTASCRSSTWRRSPRAPPRSCRRPC